MGTGPVHQVFKTIRYLNYGSQITLAHNSYSETEETGFHASGRTCTEDGRTIDFNINILMSRNYTEYMNVSIPTMADALCDPLVVNIGSDTADVRDQTFKFDLDADGKEDEISTFSKSEAGCLQIGQMKSSASSSPTYSYPQILQRHTVSPEGVFPTASGFGLI